VWSCEAMAIYEVATSGLGDRADTLLEVYLADGETLVRQNDDAVLGERASHLTVSCVEPQTLYVRVSQYDAAVFGGLTGYSISVVKPDAPLTGVVYGKVLDAVTGDPVTTAVVDLDFGPDNIVQAPYPDGTYLIDVPPGQGYTLVVSAPDYITEYQSGINVGADQFVHRPITLQPDLAASDFDGDGIPDSWETAHDLTFDDPTDAPLDFDGDGRTNLDEYYNNTDPWLSNAPSAPVVKEPLDGASTFAPALLVVFNSFDIDSIFLQYYFTLLDDDGVTVLEESDAVPGGIGETAWSPDTTLDVGESYQWQVFASDGVLVGPSVSATFMVVSSSQPPTVPVLFSPPDTTSVSSTTPALELVNSTDLDGDVVSYRFAIYDDAALQNLIAASPLVTEAVTRTTWTVSPALTDTTSYWWAAQAEDANGAASAWSVPWSFSVDTSNTPPPAPVILTPATDTAPPLPNPPTFEFSGIALDVDGDAVSYVATLDVDRTYSTGVARSEAGIVVDAGGVGRWAVLAPLSAQQTYWLHVVGTDGKGFGVAAERPFVVGGGLDVPQPLAPVNLATVKDTKPTLVAGAVAAPGGEPVLYVFELYSNLAMSSLVAASDDRVDDGTETSWSVPVGLSPGSAYYWRVSAKTTSGLTSPWSETESFLVEAEPEAGVETGCGCGGAGGSPADALWLVLLAAVLVRRRVKGSS
jgi:hypothetical protein